MGGDKVHATVDFHRAGIIENRHTLSYIFIGNTVMVLELGEDADFLPDEDGKVQPDMTSPAPLTHKNIRGREYYRKDKQ